MSRNIITKSSVATLREDMQSTVTPETPSQYDNYASQIIKLIPADIVGVYLGLQSLFSVLDKTKFIFQLSIFLIILILSPFYLKNAAGITAKKQIIIAVISYCIWAISIEGPFQELISMIIRDEDSKKEITAQLIGGVLIMIYTLVVPIIYKSKPAQ